MLKCAQASSIWLRAALVAGVTALAAPAFAQQAATPSDSAPSEAAPMEAAPTEATPPTVSEVTVTGRARVGPNVRSLSEPVSYADLDLTTADGRRTLETRIRTKASDLCRRLNEAGQGGTALVPSCERDAINSASEQQRMAIAQATPRAYAVNPPAPAESAPTAPVGETSPAAATAPTTRVTAMNPVPDTPENREAFGGPNSAAGRRTAPRGN